MLSSRLYKPQNDELIYHYCSADVFDKICTNKTIRLCDINSMNDSLEMRWGISIWEKAITNPDLLKTVGKPFLDILNADIGIAPFKGALIVVCFSLEKDLLSQWRGYADDGKGYVIGFCAKALIQLPVRPLKIEYNEKKQIHELENAIKDLFKKDRKNSYNKGQNRISICHDLFFDLAMFKNPAFSEEREVRFVHRLQFEESNNYFKLTDNGVYPYGKIAVGNDVKFFIKRNGPVSYIDYDFTNNGKINPIKEVILGPKNNSLETVIQLYLETLGIGSVRVVKSKASYR